MATPLFMFLFYLALASVAAFFFFGLRIRYGDLKNVPLKEDWFTRLWRAK